jgi:ribosomal protein S18
MIGRGWGDVDGDGKIDSADVTFLRRFIAETDKNAFQLNNSSFILANANVDGRGGIDAADVTMLRRYIASSDKLTVQLGPQLTP